MNGIPRDLLDAMKAVSKPAEEPTKKGDELPFVDVSACGAEIVEAVRRIEAIEKLKDDQEARLKSDKALLVDICKKAVYEVSRRTGKVCQSVRIGNLIYTLRKKATPHDRVFLGKDTKLDDVKRDFGQHFDVSFVPDYDVKLHLENLKPDKLVELVGIGVLEVVDFLSPTEALHKNRILSPEVQEAADRWVGTQDSVGLFREKKTKEAKS